MAKHIPNATMECIFEELIVRETQDVKFQPLTMVDARRPYLEGAYEWKTQPHMNNTKKAKNRKNIENDPLEKPSAEKIRPLRNVSVVQIRKVYVLNASYVERRKNMTLLVLHVYTGPNWIFIHVQAHWKP